MRILSFATLLYYAWSLNDFSHLRGVDRSIFADRCILEALCTPAIRGYDLAPLIRVFGLMGLIGLLTPIAALGTALTLSSLITADHALGSGNHAYYPLVILFLSLIFSRSEEYYSLNRWMRRKFFPKKVATGFEVNRVQILTIRAMQFYLTMIFFLAGVAKLRTGGSDWIFSDNLKNIFAWSVQLSPGMRNPVSDFIIVKIVEYPWTGPLLALLAVAIEISAPILYLGTRRTWPVVCLLGFFQFWNYFLLKINFYSWIILYFFWIPWSTLFSRFALSRFFQPSKSGEL